MDETIVSVRPVVLPAPGRGADLQVRVTAPLTGEALPVVVFSHGFGQSMDGYAPLAEHWAANGFVVVAPTHLDGVHLPPDDPRTPDTWRWRIDDLRRVVDSLDAVLAAVPGLAGRADTARVAVAGHSWGATSASALLGATVVGDDGRWADARVRAGVLLCLAGHGGADLTPFAAQNFAFMSPDFSAMAPPALLVAGSKDQSLLSTRGPDWWRDGFDDAPGPKTLLTVDGAEHSLGGIAGAGLAANTDEDPSRVELLQRATTAYLRTALDVDPDAWSRFDAGTLGGIEEK